ncbi:hypothetical protein AgCh_028387 [Apium graveolens]
MGDSEQLLIKVRDLEKKMGDKIRKLREGILEIKHFLESQKGNQEKILEVEESSSPKKENESSGKRDSTEQVTNKNIIPRYSKLEFPSYDGSGDPLGWLYRCDQFSNQKTNDEDKVGLAAFHLLGEAQLWCYKLEQEEPDLKWDQFKSYRLLRFGPPLSGNPLGELVNLKQVDSVEEYQKQFQTLLARATTVRGDQHVDLFTAGLNDGLRVDVEMQSPPNLVTAMNLARAFERKSQITNVISLQRSASSWTPSKTVAPTSVVPTRRDSRPTGGTTSLTSSGSINKTPVIKRLSRAEMAEQRGKGLCYNCDESYSTGHKCKRLFCLMVDDEEDVEVEYDTSPEISLHAISGIKNSQTMQLQIFVAKEPMLGLVDSGSTYNFISEAAALKAGLTVVRRLGFQVAVANGEKITSSGICEAVQLQVGK